LRISVLFGGFYAFFGGKKTWSCFVLLEANFVIFEGKNGVEIFEIVEGNF
jgi:hypothetical protein